MLQCKDSLKHFYIHCFLPTAIIRISHFVYLFGTIATLPPTVHNFINQLSYFDTYGLIVASEREP